MIPVLYTVQNELQAAVAHAAAPRESKPNMNDTVQSELQAGVAHAAAPTE